MKIRNTLLGIFALLIGTATGYSQPFENGYHGTYAGGSGSLLATDFMHYSTVTTASGYICAGTLSDPATQDTRIHVLSIDGTNGSIIWQKEISISNNDRALDVIIDPNGDIIVTGYTSVNGPNEPQMYVAKFDNSGTFLMDNIIDGFPSGFSSMGTTLHLSATTGNYIIGGFYAEPPVQYPLSNGEAVLVEIDPTTLSQLTPSNTFYISGPNQEHCTISDIIDVTGQTGYFVTGSFMTSSGNQGVLAVFIGGLVGATPTFYTHTDISFSDPYGNDERGVSAIFNNNNTTIALLSNSDQTSNPIIRMIYDANGAPYMGTEYEMSITDQAGVTLDGSGYQLLETPWTPNSFIIAGRFNNGIGTNNNNWIMEMAMSPGLWPSLIFQSGMLWDVTSAGHGGFSSGPVGPLLTTHTTAGGHPYIYTEDILTNRLDMAGVVILSPSDVFAASYGIDLVTTNNMTSLGCYESIFCNLNPTGHNPDHITGVHASTTSAFPPSIVNPEWAGNDWLCFDPTLPRLPSVTEDLSIDALDSNDDNNVSVYPNPSNGQFNIAISRDVTGKVIIRNAIGQIIFQSNEINESNYEMEIDLSNYESGIYILEYVNGDASITKKIIRN